MNERRSTSEIERTRLTRWVAREIVPHEAAIRSWLRQRGLSPEDVDDLVQEAYAKLAGLRHAEQIDSPGAYFFQTVRYLMIDQIRRARVVRIDAVGQIADLPCHVDELDPERVTNDRHELDRVLRLIEALPERCRAIIKMRKIQGLSQRDIAAQLGVSESIVENDAVKGMLLLTRALQSDPEQAQPVRRWRK
ncbi:MULTISPECIES: RNA polymerase sigma factor [Xanthomonas]|uniref:RNA polymerase sigma factor n=1 Tax=Xanthomonas TaxID=338 RepID=UPI000E1EF321|nr:MULTISPECIES: RNA polymerase sigma factor [Xanthomonas]